MLVDVSVVSADSRLVMRVVATVSDVDSVLIDEVRVVSADSVINTRTS